MKRTIQKAGSFEEEKRKERHLFSLISDEERFKLACELSEMMVKMQYENSTLPEESNFTLTR
jgi:hypothetical protein